MLTIRCSQANDNTAPRTYDRALPRVALSSCCRENSKVESSNVRTFLADSSRKSSVWPCRHLDGTSDFRWHIFLFLLLIRQHWYRRTTVRYHFIILRSINLMRYNLLSNYLFSLCFHSAIRAIVYLWFACTVWTPRFFFPNSSSSIIFVRLKLPALETKPQLRTRAHDLALSAVQHYIRPGMLQSTRYVFRPAPPPPLPSSRFAFFFTLRSFSSRVFDTMGRNHGMEGKATEEEMIEVGMPLAFRDSCAHLLIPLNKCRRTTMYLPWKCSHERHIYEKCQYLEWVFFVEVFFFFVLGSGFPLKKKLLWFFYWRFSLFNLWFLVFGFWF